MASVLVIFRLAFATLWENKLRSILTLIGMVFGNAAVIATLSSNEGAKVYIANQLASLGNKLMTIEVRGSTFSDYDLLAVKRYADEIDLGVREQIVGTAAARRIDKTSEVQLVAVDQDYFKANNLVMNMGRAAIQREFESAAPVAFLGYRVQQELFGLNTPINEHVSLQLGEQLLVLRVIGTFAEKGGAASTMDSSVFISPALGAKLTMAEAGKMLVVLKDDNRSTAAKDQILGLLSEKFGDSLKVVDAREAIERTKSIWSKQNLVGICLAAISLLTGGVGIMNIMLLSIHQRQKEIGLRKAVGARNSEIAVQFLLETVIVCLVGGLIGVGLGWGFGRQVAAMLGNWDASLSLFSVMAALSFSVLTGIIFGAVPAMRAARIDPYDALRTG